MTLITRPRYTRELNEFLNSFVNEAPVRTWTPRMDLLEKGDAYELVAEIPGYEKSDIRIEMEDGILTVSGEKKDPEVEDGSRYAFSEIRHGKFSRRIKFPAHIETEKIKATYSNGMLHLNIPKSEKAKALTIEIN